ncbi:MAG: hypothetical protein ACOC1G_03695 [Phycisphaeraceae bacterium]
MNEAYGQILASVDDVRRAYRTRRIAEGVLLTLAVVVGLLFVFAAIDQATGFGAAGRWLAAVVALTGTLAVAWFRVARPATIDHDNNYYAALAEQRLGLGNRLINALQLGGDAKATAPRLIEAIVADGARALDAFDPRPVVADKRLGRSALALGIVAVLAFGYVALGGPGARTSLMRIAMPAAAIEPFTWTDIELSLDPERRVLEGTPVVVTADISGRPVESASLHLDRTDGPRRVVAMSRDSDDRFTYTLDAAASSLRLHATAGDGRSDTVDLTVDPRPRIESIGVHYAFPGYTGLDPRSDEEAAGHVQALPGTEATLTFRTSKPLESLTLDGWPDAGKATATDDDRRTWRVEATVRRPATYRVTMTDTQGYSVEAPATYTVGVESDAPPDVAITFPGRDIEVRPDDEFTLRVVAQDDLGVGDLKLLGAVNDEQDFRTLAHWPAEGEPSKRVEREKTWDVSELDLAGGDELRYRAVVSDRNDVSADGPGTDETRVYHVLVLTPEQASDMLEQQLADYSRAIAELLKMQRRNRAETEAFEAAPELLDRQSDIRFRTRRLAESMRNRAFLAETMIEKLDALASGLMVDALTLLERYRDASGDAQAVDAGEARSFAERSLPVQDEIIAELEAIQQRLDRADQTRRRLKKSKEEEPEKTKEVTDQLDKVASDLDAFLGDLREIEEQYEKMPARRDSEELTPEQLDQLEDIDHRLDRWKKWAKDSVDGIYKLPEGFVPDGHLAENVSTIFEEIEQQERKKTTELATPIEEGLKGLAEETAEDLEMWMPDAPDSKKWVMEDPVEGTFDIPEAELPSNLQDMIGDLIEDADEYDEEADDITGAWGANMQAGWGIDDGPISSYAAKGKTGNMLPNNSEMGGRSGAGRRGKSSGQMVGGESRALEGRPTPARVTDDPYEEGVPEASKQLDPRGATGGGKKTGGGQRGLQGTMPPDMVNDMKRLAEQQKLLREKTQQVAREIDTAGRPATRVNRAVELMESAEQDLRDLRYQDAARKRNAALSQLRAAQAEADQAVSLQLQEARDLSPELREEIRSGAQKALPEGYERIVGDYYKALSENDGE